MGIEVDFLTPDKIPWRIKHTEQLQLHAYCFKDSVNNISTRHKALGMPLSQQIFAMTYIEMERTVKKANTNRICPGYEV